MTPNRPGTPAARVGCWAPAASGATTIARAGRTRRVSPARVKAKLWAGDEAQWSPDGRSIAYTAQGQLDASGDLPRTGMSLPPGMKLPF